MFESGTRPGSESLWWNKAKRQWPEKFKADPRLIFKEICPGERIFVGTGCGEPQFLVQSLLGYVRENPKAFMDAELIAIVTLGVAPYTDEKFRQNFRLNSFFIGDNARRALNQGEADYTPEARRGHRAALLSHLPGQEAGPLGVHGRGSYGQPATCSPSLRRWALRSPREMISASSR